MHDIGHSVRLRSRSRVGRQNGSAHAAHPAARGCDKPTDINIEIGANLERLEPFVEALGDAQFVIWEISAVTDPSACSACIGGALAQQFARRNPSRCRRLVLAATTPSVIMVRPGFQSFSR